MDEQQKPKWVPPYIAFPTLTGLIERMQAEGGPPSRIDRTYLDKFSGGYQSQVFATLKSLGLMGPNGEVTPQLTGLVEAADADARKQIIGDILRERYPKPVNLGTTKATQGQLEEAFREYGITGDTLRKAIAFYLGAAKYAGVPVSSNFKVPSVTRADGRPSGRKRRRAGDDGETGDEQGNTSGRGEPSWVGAVEPTIVAWLQRIPERGTPWLAADRERWLSVLKAIMDGIHADDG